MLKRHFLRFSLSLVAAGLAALSAIQRAQHNGKALIN